MRNSWSWSVKWGFEALKNVRTGEIAWYDYLKSSLVLTGIALVFLVLTLLHLRVVPDED